MALFKKTLPAKREALAAASDRLKTAREEHAAVKTALANARTAEREAKSRRGEAEDAFEASRKNAVAHLVATASGKFQPAPMSIRDAQAALDEAREAVSVAESERGLK